jgi:HTH-type transcriptional regulator / antitoxin HigA
MGSKLQNEYKPDSVSAPGETLLETLETLDMSQEELATHMGRPVHHCNKLKCGLK